MYIYSHSFRKEKKSGEHLLAATDGMPYCPPSASTVYERATGRAFDDDDDGEEEEDDDDVNDSNNDDDDDDGNSNAG